MSLWLACAVYWDSVLKINKQKKTSNSKIKDAGKEVTIVIIPHVPTNELEYKIEPMMMLQRTEQGSAMLGESNTSFISQTLRARRLSRTEAREDWAGAVSWPVSGFTDCELPRSMGVQSTFYLLQNNTKFLTIPMFLVLWIYIYIYLEVWCFMLFPSHPYLSPVLGQDLEEGSP